jgi:MFS transporter, FHS family, glucose/mannose:H+ symporter
MIRGVAQALDVPTIAVSGGRVRMPKTALGAVAACFLIMGALAAAYGPLLEHLARRFGITLPTASEVFSAHFAGALVGVFVAMWAIERISGRVSIWVALGCLGLGCAGVALASTWPEFLVGVFVIGLGFGALDLGLNLLVAHSEGRRRPALLNALNGAFGFGAVAGPILVSSLGQAHLATLYAGAAVLAVVLIPAAAGISGRLPVTPRSKRGRTEARGGGALVGIFLVGFVFYVGVETGVGGWMTSHLESVGLLSVEAASLTSGFWLTFAVGRVAAALIPDTVPPPVVIIAGSSIAAVALLAALNGRVAPVAYLVTGFAIAPIFPTAIAWLAKLRPGDSRSTSWMFPATMVGGGVIPPAIGFAVAWIGIGWVPAVLSAVAIVTIASFALAASRVREYPRSAPAS